YCSVPRDSLRVDAEHVPLEIIVVGDDATHENIARARNVRDALAEQSTGATFSDRQLQTAFTTLVENHGRQIIVTFSVRVRSDAAAAFQNRLGHQSLRPHPIHPSGRDPQIDTGDSRQIRQWQRAELCAGLAEKVWSEL